MKQGIICTFVRFIFGVLFFVAVVNSVMGADMGAAVGLNVITNVMEIDPAEITAVIIDKALHVVPNRGRGKTICRRG
jgi:glucan phosphoethanolaminetransferase (alkaline phosphatase superfamily)